MTRKDYKALANAIRDIRLVHGDSIVIMDIVEAIADVLQADNNRFDRYRFVSATER